MGLAHGHGRIFFSCKIEPQFDDHEDGDEEACHSDIVMLYDITFIKFVYITERFCSHSMARANPNKSKKVLTSITTASK